MNSPILWTGGKSKLRKKILEKIPPHKIYVEPFFGSGAIFFAKEPTAIEIINDIDQDLINFFEVVRTRLPELQERFQYIVRGRALFEAYRKSDMSVLDPIERAFRFYFIVRHGYGGLYRRNRAGKCNTPFNTFPKIRDFFDLRVIDQAHKRLKNTIIECLDYRKVIQKTDTTDTLFYFDPPYATEYQYMRGFDHEELIKVLAEIKGRFILSLDAETAAKLPGYNIEFIGIHHVIGTRHNSTIRQEAIVTNF
ncbi:MAG: DNA adenine methylase [Bacillota bacterium]